MHPDCLITSSHAYHLTSNLVLTSVASHPTHFTPQLTLLLSYINFTITKSHKRGRLLPHPSMPNSSGFPHNDYRLPRTGSHMNDLFGTGEGWLASTNDASPWHTCTRCLVWCREWGWWITWESTWPQFDRLFFTKVSKLSYTHYVKRLLNLTLIRMLVSLAIWDD